MILNRGGHRVGKGTYWNPADGHRVDILGEGVLPGTDGTTFIKMPPGGVLLLAPVVGLFYVIFLPVLGIMAILGMWLVPILGIIAGTALAGVKLCSGMFSTVGKSVTFGWTPSSAYLAGKKSARKKEDEKSAEDDKK